MKKRVRVYKAGGQSNQPTQEQIINYIAQRMSSDDYDGDTDSLKEELSSVGIGDDLADDYITHVSEQLDLNTGTQSDEDKQLIAEQEQQLADEEQALLEEQEAADEARQAQLAAMYDTNIDMSTTEDTPEDEEVLYEKLGGSIPSKRSFIKQYTKFAKMAQGGDTPSVGSDDIPGNKGRERQGLDFLNTVRNTANDAILKQEAEAQYNSIYGNPQVGAFQEGGIQQEEVDIENPMHHIGAYAAGLGDIFRNNQNIQNDAPQEQYGGFTDTDSGLYKFIGGGDNEYVDEQYQDSDIDFNQEQFARGGFRMPRRSGRQYAQAVGSPYYTASGQAANPVDLANRKVTSINVTDRGIFGRPKAYTVNYDGTTSAIPAANPAVTPAISPTTTPTGEYMPPNEFTGRRQPLANFMMRTGIPKVRDLGAKMIKSGPVPIVPNAIAETFPDDSYDKKRLPPSISSEKIAANITEMLNANKQQKFGGPIDYTQYAYGGDIAIPELHKYQIDGQVTEENQKVNPNANAIGTTKDYKGDTYDYTGRLIKKHNPNFTFGEDATKLKNPFIMDENYANPLTGEKPAVIMGADGTYKDNTASDLAVDSKTKQGTSEDYLSKRDWDKTRDNFALGSMAVNAGLDIADQVRARKQENQMLANTTAAETNYGTSDEDDSGDYDPNSGIFRPDKMGAMQSKYGGGIYAMGGNTMDDDEDVEYMTEDQIKRFLAEGGELEYV